MPTDTSNPDLSPPPFLAALPEFSPPPSRRLDPLLTPQEDSQGEDREAATPLDEVADEPSRRAPWLTLPRLRRSPDDLDGSPRTDTSTDRPLRWRGSGDPATVSRVIGGLLVVTITALSVLARPRGRTVRQPTERQRDDVAQPLARIACRHLPMDALGPDLADATEAAAALHGYVMDGPLVVAVAVDDGATSTLTYDDERVA